MKYIYLEGAYGRTYDNGWQAEADWLAGKDFKIVDGPYCSIRDAEALKELGMIWFMTRAMDELAM